MASWKKSVATAMEKKLKIYWRILLFYIRHIKKRFSALLWMTFFCECTELQLHCMQCTKCTHWCVHTKWSSSTLRQSYVFFSSFLIPRQDKPSFSHHTNTRLNTLWCSAPSIPSTLIIHCKCMSFSFCFLQYHPYGFICQQRIHP